VAELMARQRGDGSFDGLVNHAAFGVLALRAAGVSGGPVHAATSWLGRQQMSDGGFGFAPHVTSDVDDTGAALQALVAGGGRGAAVTRAVRFVRHAQQSDGGFGQYASASSNTQSTAWAVQGWVGVEGGEGPRTERVRRRRRREPGPGRGGSRRDERRRARRSTPPRLPETREGLGRVTLARGGPPALGRGLPAPLRRRVVALPA